MRSFRDNLQFFAVLGIAALALAILCGSVHALNELDRAYQYEPDLRRTTHPVFTEE